MTSPLEDRLRTELREEADTVELRAGFVATTVDQVFVRRRQRRIQALAVAACVIVILALSGVLASQAGDDSSPPVIDQVTVQTLRQTEQGRLSALVAAERPELEQLHADDFELITPTGDPLTREAYLDAVATGGLDFQTYEPVTPIEVRLYGDAAVLRYKSRIVVVPGDEPRRADGAWHTCLYENRGGDWKIVWEQTTLVDPDPGD